MFFVRKQKFLLLGRYKMVRYISIIMIFLICLTLTAAVAQETAVTSPNKPTQSVVVGQPDTMQAPSFPYVAQIIGDNVQVRSGPGTNYYVSGKLNKNDIVRVVSQKASWSCISPPPGCFSWIAKQYVKIDSNDPANGTVANENVNVRAGNADGSPLHSSIVQGILNKDDKVKLMGEEQSDYYKIYPPSFAYVWVSAEFVKPLGSDVSSIQPTVLSAAESNSPAEARYLQQYYALEKLVKAESEKPLGEQNFAKVKQALSFLAENKDAAKAARYAQYTLKRIEGFELAIKVNKELQAQEKQLNQTLDNIKKAAEARKVEQPSLGKFAAIGRFRISAIYGDEPQLKHYQILDSAGNIVCYALPEGNAKQIDLNKYMNKKVGLVGSIEPHLETSGALVKFTEIVEME
jgi:uncharacterized protein YgiM (DUF1202 family)